MSAARTISAMTERALRALAEAAESAGPAGPAGPAGRASGTAGTEDEAAVTTPRTTVEVDAGKVAEADDDPMVAFTWIVHVQQKLGEESWTMLEDLRRTDSGTMYVPFEYRGHGDGADEAARLEARSRSGEFRFNLKAPSPEA